MDDEHRYVFQCGGVIWRKISSGDMQADPSHCHLEAEGVWSVRMQHLCRKVPQILVFISIYILICNYMYRLVVSNHPFIFVFTDSFADIQWFKNQFLVPVNVIAL